MTNWSSSTCQRICESVSSSLPPDEAVMAASDGAMLLTIRLYSADVIVPSSSSAVNEIT